MDRRISELHRLCGDWTPPAKSRDDKVIPFTQDVLLAACLGPVPYLTPSGC